MGHSKQSLEEQCHLIKKLIGEGKTYKELQKMIRCSAKMISNVLKCQQNLKDAEENEQLLLKRIKE